MIIGKDSALKFAALFALVLLAVLDLIFGTQIKTVGTINCIIVVLLLGFVTFRLYQRWKEK